MVRIFRTVFTLRRVSCVLPVAFAVFIFIPAYFLRLNSIQSGITLYTIASYGLVATLFSLAYILLKPFLKNKIPKFIFISGMSLYYLLLYGVVGYRVYTGNLPSVLFFIDGEVIKTIQDTVGMKALAPFLGVMVVFFGISILIYNLLVALDSVPLRRMLATFLFLGLSGIFGAYSRDFDYFSNQVASISYVRALRSTTPMLPENGVYQAESSDNVFIVQLESINAWAVASAEKDYQREFMPELYGIGAEGTVFPMIWGNSIQTHRAQENILCGLYYNDGRSFFGREKALPVPCLPEKLRQSGYTTLFFCGWPDPSFWDSGKFMHRIGFDEVHYADFMEGEDRLYDWGYDDCDVYQRVFDYLNKHYPKRSRLFVYIEMCMNHFPFKAKDGYAFSHEFIPPENFLQKYLNSVKEQDHCLKTFYSEFKAYDNGRTHLFILSDHSWPTGIHGNIMNEKGVYNENFLIPLVYVPPSDDITRYYQNNRSNRVVDQSDLMPTVFELLSGRRYQNSFAFALKIGCTNNGYEDCKRPRYPPVRGV